VRPDGAEAVIWQLPPETAEAIGGILDGERVPLEHAPIACVCLAPSDATHPFTTICVCAPNVIPGSDDPRQAGRPFLYSGFYLFSAVRGEWTWCEDPDDLQNPLKAATAR
jgi:hypothetical protein